MIRALQPRREATAVRPWPIEAAANIDAPDSQSPSSRTAPRRVDDTAPARRSMNFGLLAERGWERVLKLTKVRILRYAAVGAGAALLQLALLAAFVEVFHIPALLASTAALSISVLVNYRLQHWLTFRSKSAHLVAGPRFIALTLVTLAANAGLFSLAALALPYLLSQIVTTLTIFPINYFLNKTFTFRT